MRAIPLLVIIVLSNIAVSWWTTEDTLAKRRKTTADKVLFTHRHEGISAISWRDNFLGRARLTKALSGWSISGKYDHGTE